MATHTEKAGAPTVGIGLAYFAMLWAVKNGYVDDGDKAEAVTMAGIVLTYVALQVRGMFSFIASLIRSQKDAK